MTGAELLAQAINALVKEAIAEATSQPTHAAMSTAAAAKFLGYTPSYLLRIAKAGELPSVGEGRGRRFLQNDLEAHRRRHRKAARVSITEDRAASAR